MVSHSVSQTVLDPLSSAMVCDCVVECGDIARRNQHPVGTCRQSVSLSVKHVEFV